MSGAVHDVADQFAASSTEPPRRLFEPLELGPLRLRNRIVLPAHETLFASDSAVSDELIAYYAARAGDLGLVVCGPDSVDDRTPIPGRVCATGPRAVAGYERLARELKALGAAVVGHLTQDGAGGRGDLTLRWEIERGVAPIAPGPGARVPLAFETGEIAAEVERWRAAVANHREGGLDGSEVDAAGGLVWQFLSPALNDRDDGYGGSLDGRLRFLREVLEAAREEAGERLVGLRWRLADGDPDQAAALAAVLDWGLVDYVSAVVPPAGVDDATSPSLATAPGYAREPLTALRGMIPVPLLGGGRIASPAEAEGLLAAGAVDAVTVARALIADAEWATKAQLGHPEEIRACIACNEGCIGRVLAARPLTCMLAPSAGRETQWPPDPGRSEAPARLAVVGAGPAGLSFAHTAARRGHEVVVFERGAEIGGQVRALVADREKRSYLTACEWMARRIEQHGGKLRTGREIGPEQVAPAAAGVLVGDDPAPFDRVVVATGSSWPAAGTEAAASADQVLAGAAVGSRALIYTDDDDCAATTAALVLAAAGHEVALATPQLRIAGTVDPSNRPRLLSRLYQGGTRILTGHLLGEVAGGRAELSHWASGEKVELEIDDLVLSTHRYTNDSLYKDLARRDVAVARVGDCIAPRDISVAVYTAEKLARSW